MPYEIERKFLIAYPDEAALAAVAGSEKTEIVQTYLLSAEGNLRVRKRGANGKYVYTRTLKRDAGYLTREEYESEITERQYLDALRDADPAYRTLYKHRWRVPYRGFVYEIDLYPFWRDRAILEVELPAPDTPIPDAPFVQILKDVSEDARYKNRTLAKIKNSL